MTAEDDWAWTFENLPKYENGKEIIYTITEDPVSDYQSEIYGMNVTNSYTPGQINIPVTKNWKDQDDADGIRPDSITVKLYANGKETGKVLILNQMNRWTDSFNNLDEYADGEKIIYSIAEVRVEGYEVSISGNSETGFVISNSHTPEIRMSLTIQIHRMCRLHRKIHREPEIRQILHYGSAFLYFPEQV